MYIGYSELPINAAAFRIDPDWTFLFLPYSIANCLFGIKCKIVFPLLQTLVVGSYTIVFSSQNKQSCDLCL